MILKRNYLFIIIGATIFLILSIVILRDILFNPGRLFVRDFIFPDIPNFPTSVWDWNTSKPNLELNKIPLNLLFIAGYSFLGSNIFINIFQLTTLFLVGFIPFIIIYLVLISKKLLTPSRALFAAVVPALIYMLNPWVLDRINNHVFMLLGMAFTPLLFFLVYRAFEGKFSWVRAILAATCLAFVSLLSSHNIFYLVPLIGLLVLLLLITNRAQYKDIFATGAVFTALYFLLSCFWILPLVVKTQSGTIKPSYDLKIESIEKLSANNTSLDIFNLNGGGAWREILASAPLPLNIGISFGLLGIILALLGIFYFPRYRPVIITTVFLIIFLLLSMGTNAPIPLYHWFFESPFKSYVWLYRDPSRFIQFLILTITVLATFATFRIISKVSLKKIKRIPFVVGTIIILIIIVASPAAYSLFSGGGGTLRSSTPPSDYSKVNNLIAGDNPTGKALWLPIRGYYYYNWNNASDIAGNFFTTSSSIPTYSLSTASGPAAKMNKYIYQNLIRENRTEKLGEVLSKINVSHVVIHTDLLRWQEKESLNLVKMLDLQKGLKKIYTSENFQVYKNTIFQKEKITLIEDSDLNRGKISELTKISESSKYLNELNRWRTINTRSTIDRNGESFNWNFNFDKKINKYSVIYDFGTNHGKFSLFDEFAFSVFPEKSNTGTELSIVIQTAQANFTFNRYNLNLGQWNDIELDLKAADEISENKGNTLNLDSIEKVIFSIYGKTKFGQYYQEGENSLKFKDLRLQFDITYGDYDPYAVAKMFDVINHEHIKSIRKGNKFEIINSDTISRNKALVFAESFDPAWKLVAIKNGITTEVNPTLFYGVINAYPLNGVPKGSKISIIYKNEDTFKIGSIISGLTIIGSIGYLSIRPLRKSKYYRAPGE